MKIATLNIDWAKKYASKIYIHKIEKALTELNADILIITENVRSLSLPGYEYAYHTQAIPQDSEYEGFDYGKYLENEIPIRTSIYSKSESTRSFPVTDPHTSVCRQFAIPGGSLSIYATIVGTRFNRKPYSLHELNNCITDCQNIAALTGDLCLAGDLNTTFQISESHLEIGGIHSRKALTELCSTCSLALTTGEIPNNIDHILLPAKLLAKASVFAEKYALSDHKGVVVEF